MLLLTSVVVIKLISNCIVPIKIFGETMMASFFVKPDSVTGTVGMRAEHPVILGCNGLRAIASAAMEPVGPSREDWKLALRWMRLASSEQEVATNSCAASVEVADGGTEVQNSSAIKNPCVIIFPTLYSSGPTLSRTFCLLSYIRI